MDHNTPNPPQGENYASRLERLTRPARNVNFNTQYSKFIRWMRFILPAVALGIAAIVFTWNSMNDTHLLPSPDKTASKSFGKNELLNAKFESSDDHNQPYTITAARAVQGEKGSDLVLLESPVADMLLNSGNWIAIKANEGDFDQKQQKLLLRGHVEMFHDKGYELESEQLHIDLKENTAWSDLVVSGRGPAGTLEATGMKAMSGSGHLIFSGPAKLVLKREVPGAQIKTLGEFMQ